MVATVYVGCVTYNSLNDLPQCLEGLRQQTYPVIKIVFLDNNSSDDSALWLEQFDDIEVIRHAENVGFGRAHNRIIEHCDIQADEYYLALNPDAQLSPNYIDNIIDAMHNRPEIGWSIGKLLLPETPARFYSVGHVIRRDGYAINNGYGIVDEGQHDKPRRIFGAAGAAVVYRGAFIHDLKGDGAFFDPRFFLYVEDIDIDWRGQRRGWQCWYIPTAVGLHHGGTASPRYATLTIANRFLCVMKNAFWVDLLYYNLPLIVMHTTFRLITTPKAGWMIAGFVSRHAWGSIRLRTKPQISRSVMLEWFTEPIEGEQPVTTMERIKSFWGKKR